MKNLLIQTQLSNIVDGKFDLACDSGWQMTINRAREMLKLNPDLYIDIMAPPSQRCIASPPEVNADLWAEYSDDLCGGKRRLRWISTDVFPHALVTRYDFKWSDTINALNLVPHRSHPDMRYDAVYVNDPMLLRSFKAMFHLTGGYQPKFFVHSHFVDLPTIPKFPVEASLWLGQCEAAFKADFNFWQCKSAMDQFFTEMDKWFVPRIVDVVRKRSIPWDDGYSISEITSPIDEGKLRFDVSKVNELLQNKVVLFFPNRISPSSGDYTRGWRFVHEFLGKLRLFDNEPSTRPNNDFVVVCGNPNMKLTNDELVQICGKDGYIKLHDFTLNRDEYKFIASHTDIVVALYDEKSDAYGGTALRECVELGCCILSPNVNEYSRIAREAGGYPFLCRPDLFDLPETGRRLMNYIQANGRSNEWIPRLQDVVRRTCSYEATAPEAMRLMGLLPEEKPDYAALYGLNRTFDGEPPSGACG